MRIVKATRSKKDTWIFQLELVNQDTKKSSCEFFEWRHQRAFTLMGNVNQQYGSVLVRLSTNQAVARIQYGDYKVGSALAQDLVIEYLGAGQSFGGLWKIIALVLGVFEA